MGREIAMADEKEPIHSVQVFGRKKTATAVAYCKRGKGLIKVNGRPLELVEPRAPPSGRLSPSLWSPTTRSTSTSRASRRSRTSSSSSTVPCWWLIPEGTSPRSLEVPEPEPDTRSLTVKLIFAVATAPCQHLGQTLTVF